MTVTTTLLILLSLVVSGAVAYFQYFYKTQNSHKIHWVLAVLRFLVVFGILLLLINPKITKGDYEIQKTPLPIVIDNSSSVSFLKADKIAQELYQKLASNSELKDKFEIQPYKFDAEIEPSDSVDFKGNQTNIEAVAKNLKSIYRNRIFPMVLISDGNSTIGDDYVFQFDKNNKVYPLVLGDTTTFFDLKVNQINVNKYVFHKNKFPVEVFLQYAGTQSVTADFDISIGNSILAKEKVSFSPSKKTAVLSLLLPANQTGLQILTAKVKSKFSEKNTYNNTKKFAVEVIDQKSEIAIITSFNHPDVGALKRAIESNVQRKVTICSPKEIADLKKYNLLVFYQPTFEFKNIYDQAKANGLNIFTITGTTTDFSFLNQQQSDLVFAMSNQKEDYVPVYNSQFNSFVLEDIGFDKLPPLQNAFGTVTVKGKADVALTSKIRNVDTHAPLLMFFDNQGKRSAYLLGENSWKWRMMSHLNLDSFEKYDIFIDKIVQYLISNDKRKSLVVNHENFYNSGEPLEITAQYFNKNYEFDEKARLTISVINKKTHSQKKYDLLKSSNAFKVNLDGLNAGQYQFSVKELNSNTVYNGYFEILDFDIEKQFVNPDLIQLKQLATETQGAVFMPNQVDLLIKKLIESEEYKAIQKDKTTKTPLIDWMYLLIILSVLLSCEWFIRKYHGML